MHYFLYSQLQRLQSSYIVYGGSPMQDQKPGFLWVRCNNPCLFLCLPWAFLSNWIFILRNNDVCYFIQRWALATEQFDLGDWQYGLCQMLLLRSPGGTHSRLNYFWVGHFPGSPANGTSTCKRYGGIYNKRRWWQLLTWLCENTPLSDLIDD